MHPYKNWVLIKIMLIYTNLPLIFMTYMKYNYICA